MSSKSIAKIKIKQVKSTIRTPHDQRKTIKGLGLGKMNRVVELENTPSVRGMIKKVIHLIEVL